MYKHCSLFECNNSLHIQINTIVYLIVTFYLLDRIIELDWVLEIEVKLCDL